MSAHLIDHTGDRFGWLVVLGRTENGPDGQTRWVCRCDCGGLLKIVFGSNLRTGKTRSCGCQRWGDQARLNMSAAGKRRHAEARKIVI